MLSATSRVLVEELLRLTTLLERAATPDDIIAAVRGDPEHKLRPAFRNLTSVQAWPARLAWLIDRMRLEQGLPLPELSENQELVDELRARNQRCIALGAAMTELTRVCAEHWPAIMEADGEDLARQLIAQLERTRRQIGCCV